MRSAVHNRMLKSVVLIFMLLLSSVISIPSTWAAEHRPKGKAEQKAGVDLAKSAVSAVVMDAATGQVLFEKNMHEKLPPASITKIMSMLLIMEALESGRIKLTDRVRASEHAASMGGSQIFLEPGEQMTVDEMMKGIAVASANDATVAMAEHIAGSEEEFVKMMNERAEQLGLKNTHFKNSNGLPVAGHYTSAYDIALMSRELLKHEQILKWTSIYSDYLRKDSEKPFWLVNTNKLIRYYPGMDGLKTGFTGEAKYCLSATAKRGDFRVITVVMGEPTSPQRNAEILQMMDWAFSQFTSKTFYKAGQVVEKVKLDKGNEPSVQLVAADTLGVVMKKGEKSDAYTKQITFKECKAPVKKGQVLGAVVIYKDGKEVGRTSIVAANDIGKAGFWKMFKRTVDSWLTFGQAS
jgi:D-alanyl-D-alanine carboxypeptidase (penicillin-binding protein 5/6)